MRVVTAFCLACVCAELLVQLVEAGWARRCIKVVAGLYILTVLLRAISALPARTAQWLQPVQASASIEGVETTILTEAAKRLKNLRMKAARVGCDLSQEELAAKVGVTRQTIGMIEAGRFNPSLALCVAICRALGKTLNDLFWDEEGGA